MNLLAIDTVPELRDAVREARSLRPVGARTKPGLWTAADDDVDLLDVTGIRGIVEYDPGELTLTARAGTPIDEVQTALSEHGQYLPFDPPFAGATLGGAVAAGVSGSRAFRHGTVRNFVIGVQFVDGTGTLVRAGGKVVKNAAGFDLAKLMVGSAGRLGVLTVVSCKVLPAPPATVSVVLEFGDTGYALAAMARLAGGPVELEALDLQPPATLVARIGGPPQTLMASEQRVRLFAGAERTQTVDDDGPLWHGVGELSWAPPDAQVVRVATTAHDVPTVLEWVADQPGAAVRFANAANVAWLALPSSCRLHELDAALESAGLSGMTLIGPPGRSLLGRRRGGAFAQRIREALDPESRFPED